MAKLVARNGYEADYNSSAFGLDFSKEVPIVKQSFAEECDINNIVRRMNVSGFVPPAMDASNFGDVSDVPDYHSCLNFLNEANARFMALPSQIRDRFNNDPGEFLAFTSVADNLPEMVKMGLAVERSPAAPEGAPARPQEAGAGDPAPAVVSAPVGA